MNQFRNLFVIGLMLFLVGCDSVRGEIIEPGDNSVSGEDSSAQEQATKTPQPESSTAGNTTILADGVLVAANPALSLSFQTNGRLLTVLVKAGDLVEAGDLVATLDDEALQEAVTNAELAVAQAQNGLAQAQLSLNNLLSWEPDEMAVAAADANLPSIWFSASIKIHSLLTVFLFALIVL